MSEFGQNIISKDLLQLIEFYFSTHGQNISSVVRLCPSFLFNLYVSVVQLHSSLLSLKAGVSRDFIYLFIYIYIHYRSKVWGHPDNFVSSMKTYFYSSNELKIEEKI